MGVMIANEVAHEAKVKKKSCLNFKADFKRLKTR